MYKRQGNEGSSSEAPFDKSKPNVPPPPISRRSKETSPKPVISVNQIPITREPSHKVEGTLATLEGHPMPKPLPPPPVPSRSSSSLKSTASIVDHTETPESKEAVSPPFTPRRRKSSIYLNESAISTDSSRLSSRLSTPKNAVVSPKAPTQLEKPPIVKKPAYLSAVATNINNSEGRSPKATSSGTTSDEEPLSKKKSTPKIPVKKPELEKLSIESWTPLKPS